MTHDGGRREASATQPERSPGDRLAWLFRRQSRVPHPLQELLRRHRAAAVLPESEREDRRG